MRRSLHEHGEFVWSQGNPRRRRARATRSTASTRSSGDGLDVASLPYSLKILLENLLRTEDGADITADDIRALAGWDADAEPSKEIQFTPARVIMQDFTGVPCVVDLATMREAMADLGGDPAKINPLAPAELVIDHSVIADVFGTAVGLPAQRRDRVRAQPRALPVPALGPGRVRRLQGRAARHRHRAPGQHRAPGPGRLHPRRRRRDRRLPRHVRRHRLAHDDGQRPRRGRLGRRRHRGRGGDARPAGVDADPARGRLQAVRRAARGRDRDRPRAHDHRACCASTAWSASSSSSTAPASPRCRWPTGPRSATCRRSTARRSRSSRSTTRRCTTCGSPAAPTSRSRWSRPTPRSRASGTTPTSSRATPSTSSSTCRRSCRRSPGRSARRTGSR